MDGILEKKLDLIKLNIKEALKKSQKSSHSVKLLVASKGQSIEKLQEAYKLGLRIFGENYLKELEEKQKNFHHSSIVWHFIGKIQTNKLKKILKKVCLIHSVDTKKIVKLIAQESHTPCPFLLQLNLSKESTKGGIFLSELESFLDLIQKKKNLVLKGLMTMPPLKGDSRPYFAKLRETAERYSSSLSSPHTLSTLSMGTSQDYKVAIEEGATIIRLGTSLLGERN